MNSRFITAIGTPLTADDRLHEEGLGAHLADQADAGIHGILVAGTMGLLQLLSDETYRRLVERSVTLWKGKGELLVGAGDASFARTRDRIEFINRLPVDGVAVLAPYFLQFTQAELIDYYRALADGSRSPLYLYDLPQRTRTKLAIPTVLELARHPNIRGIKCSDDFGWTRQVIDELRDRKADFRVIVAQPTLVDVLLRSGVNEHLDGMWAIAPRWTMAIGRAAARGDWHAAAAAQRDLTTLLQLVGQYGLAVMAALLGARGIPGSFLPRPGRPLAAEQRDAVLATDIVQRYLQSHSAPKDAPQAALV